MRRGETITPLSACSFLPPSWTGHPSAAAASLFSKFQSQYAALSIVLESSSRIPLSQASAGTGEELISGFDPVDPLNEEIKKSLENKGIEIIHTLIKE